jgi:hypothetical protein
MDVDLFGEVVIEPVERKSTPARGYVSPPGTGPEGETCKSCRHVVRRTCSRVYYKCGLARSIWTRGRGSDILMGSPACEKWEG